MLDVQLRAVDRVFAHHPKSYRCCERGPMHEAEVRVIWATPLGRLSGGADRMDCQRDAAL